jgi:hypothetical protein
MNSHSVSDHSKWFIRTHFGETRGPFTALQITERKYSLKIAELWGLSRELHGYVTSPRGSLNSLKNKLTEIQDKPIRLRSELNTLLDFRQ